MSTSQKTRIQLFLHSTPFATMTLPPQKNKILVFRGDRNIENVMQVGLPMRFGPPVECRNEASLIKPTDKTDCADCGCQIIFSTKHANHT